MFVYLVISMSKKSNSQQKTIEGLNVENRGQSETLENMEGMLIKLIDRWNKSDDTRDRRHEDLLKEIQDVSDDCKEMKGSLSRINGK
jgi:peptidoglycan hydrolase CwlO-like protein